MRRVLLTTLLCLSTAMGSFAQQAASDAPATREDVQKYLELMRSREMMTKMMDAMLKPIHQMIHERYLKDKDKLPPDFEAQENKKMDDMLKNFPFEEMLQAMVPVYQRHFTKDDINNFIAFYSAPTGQKLLREMPAIMAESMQSVMPLMQKHVEAMKERMQQQASQMIKDSKSANGEKSRATPN